MERLLETLVYITINIAVAYVFYHYNLSAFQPVFAHFRKSRYADKFVLVTQLEQLRALERKLDFDQLDDEFFDIHQQNPCKMNCWLTGIQNGMVTCIPINTYVIVCICTHSQDRGTRDLVIDLVEDYNMKKEKSFTKTQLKVTKLMRNST